MIETIADDDGRLAPGRKELGARAAEAVRQRQRLITELLRIEGQIVKLNREYLPRFVAAIGPEAGSELQMRYRLMAYPSELMLDPTSPSAIYRHALGVQELPNELRCAFEEQWTNYVRERELRIQKMCGVQDKLYQHLIDTGGTSPAERAARNEEWFELQRERLDANRNFVRRLKSMLPADVVSAMRESFDDYGERSARQSEEIELHYQRLREAEARRRE
jgi:hypothetical protein